MTAGTPTAWRSAAAGFDPSGAAVGAYTLGRFAGGTRPAPAPSSRAFAAFDPTETVRADARAANRPTRTGRPASDPRAVRMEPPPPEPGFGIPGWADALAAHPDASDGVTEAPLLDGGRTTRSLTSTELLTTGGSPADDLLALVAPYLVPTTLAVEPVLAAHGLTGAASVADVIAIEGLLDALVAIGFDVRASVDAPAPPGGGGRVDVPDDLEAIAQDAAPWAGWTSIDTGGRDPASDAPFGVAEAEGVTPALSGFTLGGEPCVPDLPAFESYYPKCTDLDVDYPDPPREPPVDCTLDPVFIEARDHLASMAHFQHLPDEWWGRPYKAWLAQSVTDDLMLPLYQCAALTSPSSTLKSIFAQCCTGDPLWTIRIGQGLIDLTPRVDLGGIALGPRDLRAGIVLHEHVHRVDYLNNVPDLYFLFADPRHPCSITEYNAAYLQALYYGATECQAGAFALAYAVNFCCPGGQTSCATSYSEFEILGIALEALLACVQVSGLATGALVAWIVQLTTDPLGFVASLLAILPAELAAMYLYALIELPPVVGSTSTPSGGTTS